MNDLTAEGNGAVDADLAPKAVLAEDAPAKVADLEAIGRAHADLEGQADPEVAIGRIFDGTIHANANAASLLLPCRISTFSSFRTTKASSPWHVKSK